MKVRELIEFLQQCDPEKTVRIEGDYTDDSEIGSVREYWGFVYIGPTQEEFAPSMPVPR